MEKQKMDIVHSKREHRYDDMRELIGQLTLIENHIRLRQCNGALYRDEISLRILLDQHRDALYELGMRLRDLKKLDSEDEDKCIEDDECNGCVDCDMRAEDDEVRIAKNRRAEDDEECKDIDLFKDADEAVRNTNEDTCEVDDKYGEVLCCKQIHDIDILRELYSAWLNYCDVCSVENAMFLHCGKFYITFERDIDNLISEHIFVPHYIFENNQDEYVHYACFDQKNFQKLTQRIEDESDIDCTTIILNNNEIATRLNYD